MDMRPRLELRQDMSMLNEISLDQLPPEYKARELREALNLMRRLSEHDLVELGADEPDLAKEMLASHIEWNPHKNCYYLSKASLLNQFNYNYLQYVAVTPKNKNISVRFSIPFSRAKLEDLIEHEVDFVSQKKRSLVCKDEQKLLEVRSPFVKILAQPEDEHYDLSLDTAVEAVTRVHEKNLLVAVPDVSMNQYLLGFFMNITDYLTTRGQVKQVLTNFDLFLNKGLQSCVMNEENVTSDDFYHKAKRAGCHVVKRDFASRHIKYFFCDIDKNLIIGFDADLDRPLIEKRLESPMQVSIDGGEWVNKEELEYDKVTVLQLEDRVEERDLPGTRLLRHSEHAATDLEYVRGRFEDKIQQKGSEKTLVHVRKGSLTIEPDLNSMEKKLAFEVANAIYDQALLTTPLADREKQKSYLRGDERTVINEVNRRARPYVERVKGASVDYAILLAQRDIMKEMFSQLQQVESAGESMPLIEAAKRYKLGLANVLSAAKQGCIKTDADGNVAVQDFEKYVEGLKK